MRVCVGDWMKLRCGDRVHVYDDPRHEGRVEAIHNSAIVLIRWDDTRWFEEVELSLVVKVETR